jgi:hypothetical protein
MTYVKQILNREFLDTLDTHQDQYLGFWNGTPKPTENLFWVDEETKADFFEDTLKAGWIDEHDDDHEKDVKVDMIKKIERETVLEAAIRPLQIKIKEMLNSPHNRRGRAFIENAISWAFETTE